MVVLNRILTGARDLAKKVDENFQNQMSYIYDLKNITSLDDFNNLPLGYVFINASVDKSKVKNSPYPGVTGFNVQTVIMDGNKNYKQQYALMPRNNLTRTCYGGTWSAWSPLGVDPTSSILEKVGTAKYNAGNQGNILKVKAVDSAGNPKLTTDLVWVNPDIPGQRDANMAVAIQSGGAAIYASGEAGWGFLTAMKDEKVPAFISSNGKMAGEDEKALLVSDGDVFIGTGYQDGGNTGNWWKFGADGSFSSSDSTKASLTAMIANISYPVGSYYISSDSKSPDKIFGIGTWVQVKGKTIVGVDPDDKTFASSGLTGGEKTHTLSVNEMPSHTHAQNAHAHSIDHDHGGVNTSSNGNHTHKTWDDAGKGNQGNLYHLDGSGTTVGSGNFPVGLGWGSGMRTDTSGYHNHWVDLPNYSGNSGNATATNQNTGGGAAHNNLQPYITAYIWQRTE